MPVFLLDDRVVFPPPELADPEGVVAVGGDLTPQRLVAAYAAGIFPWYEEGQPILWWSPDPRFVLYTDRIHISHSMRRLLRQGRFRFSYDHAFADVVDRCAGVPRKGSDGTWLTSDMRRAYTRLNGMGLAHSVEAWEDERIVGGLYGVSLGRCFFGESMFSLAPNASKSCLVVLAAHLRTLGFALIDCQVQTAHLESMGAQAVPRERFLGELSAALEHEPIAGDWEVVIGAGREAALGQLVDPRN